MSKKSDAGPQPRNRNNAPSNLILPSMDALHLGHNGADALNQSLRQPSTHEYFFTNSSHCSYWVVSSLFRTASDLILCKRRKNEVNQNLTANNYNSIQPLHIRFDSLPENPLQSVT